MADEAHIAVDQQIAELEKRLNQVYTQATEEMIAKQKAFMAEYERKLEAMKARLTAGDITPEYFKGWKRNQAYTASWYRLMIEELSYDAVNVDVKAAEIINGELPKVYAENFNYGTYQVEIAAQVDTSFTMYDQNAVARLVKDNPQMYAQAAVDVAKDATWNLQKFTGAITQGILQGESIPQIAKRVQGVSAMDYRSAIRTARTMMTGAQNAGRIDSYRRAESMGIQGMKRWLATLDKRTRHTHALMDGEEVETAEAFSNHLEFPGDTSGDPAEYMNCRCTLQYVFEGVDYENAGRFDRLEDMTYDEWQEYHREALGR